MSSEKNQLLLTHAADMLDDLLDEVAALLTWTIEFSHKNRIPSDAALGFHIQRIIALLHEMGHPPSVDLVDRVLHGRDDKLPEPVPDVSTKLDSEVGECITQISERTRVRELTAIDARSHRRRARIRLIHEFAFLDRESVSALVLSILFFTCTMRQPFLMNQSVTQ